MPTENRITPKQRLYLAGPMTGFTDFNYPAFHAEAARLRALGYHVESPAENEAPACGTWEAYLRIGLRQMLTCDCVALMPGWADSKGALLERSVGLQVGLSLVFSSEIQAEEQAA